MSDTKKWKEKFEKYLSTHRSDDGSHDLSHFQRVWKITDELCEGNENRLVLLAASYFHDIINYPKDHPKRSKSSIESGVKAKEILKELGFPNELLDQVEHAIASHSFSANISPETSEAKVLQDADRMESLGAIGLARTFYVAGRMGSQLFDPIDPYAKNRVLDDKKFAIDHFETKLLKLPATMQTEKGKKEANNRVKILINFLDDLKKELFLDD